MYKADMDMPLQTNSYPGIIEFTILVNFSMNIYNHSLSNLFQGAETFLKLKIHFHYMNSMAIS